MKKLTKVAKIVLATGMILCLTTLVTGTLLTYFAEVTTTLNVTQAVTVDGNDWNVPIIEGPFTAAGGDITYSATHIIVNHGTHDVSLAWTYTGDPDLIGITVTAVDPDTHVPISLDPLTAESSVSFVFEYNIAELIQPGTYTVTATLAPI